ncbi:MULTISPECIES: hypothetical protein [unclassified Chryseobacterium]|uniref:hypothetical protein n=1 Tax=unclassified Chryseobacterium TaxID=2593645 RepID=UPI0028A12D8B|nr:hypothetical protein [Chryseobacterium sp.]
MIAKFKISVFFILGLNFYLPAQEVNPNKLKNEAQEFAISYVKLYFNGDCEETYSLMSESLIHFEKKDIKFFDKEKIKDRICETYNKAVRDKSKSFDDYLQIYETRIYSPYEFEEALDTKLPNTYIPKVTEFFFIGGYKKDSQEESFIWDDVFIFMVRKEHEKWLVVSI